MIGKEWVIEKITNKETQYVNLVIFGYKDVFTTEQLKFIVSELNIPENTYKEIKEDAKEIIIKDKEKIQKKVELNITGCNIQRIKNINYIKKYGIYLCKKHYLIYKDYIQLKINWLIEVVNIHKQF